VLPRRRRGRAYERDERRFLTRQQLARLLADIPEQWRPLFELLALTGLRISEAIGLRVMDAGLDTGAPCVHVRRAIVNGQLTAPKSRHGRRTIPISLELADRLRELVAGRGETELLFRGAQGAALRAGNLRYRVLIPAAHRAGVPWARFHTLRHTCAAMLIDAGASPLRLQRWMGHHSAAFTLDTYGHLLRDDLGPHLDLGSETDNRSPPATLVDVRRRGTGRAGPQEASTQSSRPAPTALAQRGVVARGPRPGGWLDPEAGVQIRHNEHGSSALITDRAGRDGAKNGLVTGAE
jgi:hypothetical protein